MGKGIEINLTILIILLTFCIVINKIAGVAQLVEHGTENPGVPSSILGPGTVNSIYFKSQKGGMYV